MVNLQHKVGGQMDKSAMNTILNTTYYTERMAKLLLKNGGQMDKVKLKCTVRMGKVVFHYSCADSAKGEVK